MIGLGLMTGAKMDGKPSAHDKRRRSRELVLQAMSDYARDDIVAAHGHMQEAAFLCRGANIKTRPAFEWSVKGFDPGLACILHRDTKSLKIVLNATCNPIEYLDAVVDLEDPQGAALLTTFCPTGRGEDDVCRRYHHFILRALASKNPAIAGAVFGALPEVSWLNLRVRSAAPATTTAVNRDAMKAAFNAAFNPNR